MGLLSWFDGRLLACFMENVLKQSKARHNVIVDDHTVHRSVAAGQLFAANEARLRLGRQSGYRSNLNPEELFNQDLKTNRLGEIHPSSRVDLMAEVLSHLRRRQRQSQFIRNHLRERHVRYAAAQSTQYCLPAQ